MHPAIQHHQDLAARWEGKYRKRSFAGRERLLHSFLKRFELAGSLWLDAGCGTGRLSRLLARMGASVMGVDAATPMLDVARQEAAAEGLGDRTAFQYVETVERLPFAVAQFDGVLCSSVLEYLDGPGLCLGELSRTLKPGGPLLLTAPNRRSLVRRSLAGVFGVTRSLGRPWPRWLALSRNEYSAAQLRDALGLHGFEVLDIVCFGGPLPSWLQGSRWLGSLLLALARKSESGRSVP
jgi:2-polyprenyl-6-hydroxyphenyl methylase/3-demethylubiquinone-9 3-methyltransferase